MPNHAIIDDELANSIDKTRKQVTVLFTDIVDSSRYWDQFGDIKGRMMVDRHNRLVFPVIRKFHGRVIKTIGDGLMAAFKRPNDALNAAIGIQQILQKMRDADRSFHAKVRIGLHTGMAIVEQNDVFGDAVNVAKRVEGFGDANEIYLSEATAEVLNEKKHAFHKKGSFVPKGKREPMTVYRCRWNEYKDFTRGLKINSDFPLDTREKGDIVAFSLIAAAVLALLALVYLRYMVADALADAPLHVQLLCLNPALALNFYPFLLPVLVSLLLILVLALMWMKTIPYIVLRLLKGVAGFGLGYCLVFASVIYFDVHFATRPGEEITKTETQFVRLPYVQAKSLLRSQLPEKTLYAFFEWDMLVAVQAGSKLERDLAELKIKYRKQTAEEPQQNALAMWSRENLSGFSPRPWYFRLLDLCAMSLGLMGFISGFMNFHISPR